MNPKSDPENVQMADQTDRERLLARIERMLRESAWMTEHEIASSARLLLREAADALAVPPEPPEETPSREDRQQVYDLIESADVFGPLGLEAAPGPTPAGREQRVDKAVEFMVSEFQRTGRVQDDEDAPATFPPGPTPEGRETDDRVYIPERDGRRCIEHPRGDHELACVTCMESSMDQAIRETQQQAFAAGFRCAQDGTDRYGEWHGESIEDEFAEWLTALAVKADTP